MIKYIFSFISIVLINLVYAQSPLCPSTATQFCCEYVVGITINGQYYAGNTGFNGPGYYDYTSTPVPDINAGDIINISYTVRTNGNYRQYFNFWFDFNGNGILTDPGELVLSENFAINNTTQTFNRTFTVPTDVFNGEVYMRFIMQFSGNPTICGNYAYGNTFDFKTNITGAIDNFNHTVSIFNSDTIGINAVPVQLWVSPKNQNNFTLNSTYNTNLNGIADINTTLRTDINDFRLVVTQPNIQPPNITDANTMLGVILNQNPTSVDYYKWDLNTNDVISISDLYILFKKINSINISPEPLWRYFDDVEWYSIVNSFGSVKSTYNGNQSMIIDNPIIEDETLIFLIRTAKLD